jgi:hypothetical protein
MKKLYLIPLLLLTACSTTKPPKLVLRPEPTPPMDDSSLRYPEVVRAYYFGRYVDPNDDLVMHGQHVVYRVEENARWDLHPATTHPGPIDGSPVSNAPLRSAAFSPTPVNGAILAEVNAQRLATAEIMAEAKILTGALARFQAALQQTKTNLMKTAMLRVQVNDMQQQLDALKAAQARMAAPVITPSTNQPPDNLSDTNLLNSHEFNP